MEIFLQFVADRLTLLGVFPTFIDLTNTYGPFLGTVILFVIIMLWMQHHWYSRALKAKNEEIKRLVEREKDLYVRTTVLLDKAIEQL
jgi:hypothetical protein